MHVAARHHADSPFIEAAEDVPLVPGGIFSAEPRSLPVAACVPARLAGGIGRCLPALGGRWRISGVKLLPETLKDPEQSALNGNATER